MEQKSQEIPPEYYQIGKILNDYKQIICHKFRTNQALLIQQLQEKAKKLKQNIAFYKKQTSSQNIQKLISKKRHQKQSQRLQLQVQWRNLTEKYKKLQEEQKKINEQNRQNKFDLENLQRKICQLRQQNQRLNAKIFQLKEENQNEHFITQIKTSYISPYKYKQQNQKSLHRSKEIFNTGKVSANFRLKLDRKLKLTKGDKQNEMKNCQLNVQNLQHKQKQLKVLQQHKNKVLKKIDSNMEDLQLKNLYSYQQREKQSKEMKFPFGKGHKWQELMHYLNKPQVRDKIFDLLRK